MDNGVRDQEDDMWQKFDQWQLVLPPSRPSLYHLQIIQKVLDKMRRDMPAAVLGSTPELRDLLFRLGYRQVYVFDKSNYMYTQMSNLRLWRSPENFVLGNWLETLSQYKNYFGVILSDLTSGNVPYIQQPYFYESVAMALAPDGIFVDKVLTHKKEKRQLEDLKIKYSRLPFNLLYVNHFSCEFLFCSELLNLKQMVDSSLFYEILNHELLPGPLEKFLRASPSITPFDTFWYYGKEWAEISTWYFRPLTPLVVYEEEKDSPYHGNLKIIVGRRN